jgi:hypothetical protein
MGLEAYLLRIEFQTPITENKTIALLEEIGMCYLKDGSCQQTTDSYGDLFFELRTSKGLTEANVTTSPNDPTVQEFSLRFSILSPKTVVDQTFELLQKLNNISRIDVFDKEIRNHIMRRLRQTGKVDQNFEGLNGQDDESINKLCFISLDAEDFKRNDLEIMKRQTVLENIDGEIIEGGSATINFIKRKGMFERFLGWIKKEL